LDYKDRISYQLYSTSYQLALFVKKSFNYNMSHNRNRRIVFIGNSRDGKNSSVIGHNTAGAQS